MSRESRGNPRSRLENALFRRRRELGELAAQKALEEQHEREEQESLAREAAARERDAERERRRQQENDRRDAAPIRELASEAAKRLSDRGEPRTAFTGNEVDRLRTRLARFWDSRDWVMNTRYKQEEAFDLAVTVIEVSSEWEPNTGDGRPTERPGYTYRRGVLFDENGNFYWISPAEELSDAELLMGADRYLAVVEAGSEADDDYLVRDWPNRSVAIERLAPGEALAQWERAFADRVLES